MTARLAWLLDTNVVSEMMRPKPAPYVADFLDSIAAQGMGLAAITVWEILNGIGGLDPGRRREDLARRLQDLLDDFFDDCVLRWTVADARVCARIMEDKRRRGESLGNHLPDAMLAGTAASRGLGIVSRNEREFRNIGVNVINPWTTATAGTRLPEQFVCRCYNRRRFRSSDARVGVLARFRHARKSSGPASFTRAASAPSRLRVSRGTAAR